MLSLDETLGGEEPQHSDECEQDEAEAGEDADPVDADPQNEEWIRIVRAQRQSGRRLPNWAGLWLLWVGYDREDLVWWGRVGEVAGLLGVPPFRDDF